MAYLEVTRSYSVGAFVKGGTVTFIYVCELWSNNHIIYVFSIHHTGEHNTIPGAGSEFFSVIGLSYGQFEFENHCRKSGNQVLPLRIWRC